MPPQFADTGTEVDRINVRINYDIIRLFSEGLYSSPHKAIEELVSNSYDAGAQNVHILLPDESESVAADMPPLWVVDDGDGMNEDGFHQLWRIADSNKADASPHKGRPLIGQFGIGKLAAYVLARNLTHISRRDDKLLLATMNFQDVKSRQADDASPIQISLREIEEGDAKRLLANIEHRSPSAWSMLFGKSSERSDTWTAAALSDFRDLYKKLQSGRLRWVLRTGLPLRTDFNIWLDDEPIKSSKDNPSDLIQEISINEDLSVGNVKGTASIYHTPLDRGKSENIGRSYGFFIRVRGRIINLDDDTFGMKPFNHAAWSRFSMEIDADGLRDHLLSSREGVRDSDDVREFRKYIHEVFNKCRTAYENQSKDDLPEVDLAQIIKSKDMPISRFIDPILWSVRDTLKTRSESFYLDAPKDEAAKDGLDWLNAYEKEIAASGEVFAETVFGKHGVNAQSLRYDPTSKKLSINSDHPFIDKIRSLSNEGVKLFAHAEVLIEGQLGEVGVDRVAAANFLLNRDYALRLVAAGMAPTTASEIIRLLDRAPEDPEYMEVATGKLFHALGFEYQRAGGYKSGPDGILYAQLGRHADRLADYKVVYDAKQTNEPAVPASKIDFGNIERFRQDHKADYSFFIARAYQGEDNDDSALNYKLAQQSGARATLLKVKHLRRLAELHYKYGVTLTDVRNLFENAYTVPEVNEWLDRLEAELTEKGDIPLQVLLKGLEREKEDTNAVPSVAAVRKLDMERLGKFEVPHLVARLKAVEGIIGTRWLEVNREANEVIMHQTSEQILNSLDRNIHELDAFSG